MATAAKTEPSLCSALASAFAEIEGAAKDKVNPHFKSKYADLSSVIDAIKPALIKHRLFFTQATHDAQGGVCVETQVHHESGDSLSFGKLFVPANKNDAQGYGSALTYARRYSLMTAFGVPAEDDDGNAASKPANDTRPTNGNGGNGKDAPFPQGPAKNVTSLKDLGRDFWRDVEACDDPDQLEALLATNAALTKQISEALPSWWTGGSTKNGDNFEGLGTVITRKQLELSNANPEWRANPLIGG